MAYCAGLYEGEGTCSAHFGTFRTRQGERRRRRSPQYTLQISMTDQEPLERFQEAFGFGKVYGPYTYPRDGVNPGYKPLFKFCLDEFEKVQAVIAALWPWLSPRRKEQARRVLQTRKEGHHPL